MNKIIVLTGPSGCGKSTLINKLLNEFKGKFEFSISHTTRKNREGEVNDVHYHFVNCEFFEDKTKKDFFIEYTKFNNEYYGTSYDAVNNVINNNKHCILDIDIEGVKNLKKQNKLDCKFIFIKAPDLKELENRLRNRKTENEESIKNRLEKAKIELQYADSKPCPFDSIIINENLEEAYKKLKDLIFISH